MPASGDDDSPMANRGCRPRSRSATRQPEPPRDHRQDRAAEAGADDGEVNVRAQAHATRRRHRAARGSSRASRAARRREQRAVERAARCPTDRRTRACRRRRDRRTEARPTSASCTTHSRSRRPSRGRGSAGSASIAPLPPRVGITDARRRAHGRRAVRPSGSAHSAASCCGTNGGLSSTNTRSAMSCRDRNVGGVARSRRASSAC